MAARSKALRRYNKSGVIYKELSARGKWGSGVDDDFLLNTLGGRGLRSDPRSHDHWRS